MTRAALLLLFVAAGCATNRGAEAPTAALRTRSAWSVGYGHADSALATLGALAANPATSDDALRAAFGAARDAYKGVEGPIEFFAPAAARALNGAPLDRAEEDAPDLALPAEGLQVVEALLYPAVADSGRVGIVPLVGRMRAHLRRARQVLEASPVSDAQAWEAMRLELVRLSTIDLGGFDSPVADRTAHETARALDGVRASLEPWMATLRVRDAATAQSLDARLRAASRAADSMAHGDFDRLALLTDHLVPASRALVRARTSLGIAPVALRSLLRPTAASPYDAGAFDATGLLPPAPDSASLTAARRRLGAQLFHSTALSGNGARSCGSCHQPGRAFTDGRASAAALAGRRAVLRNTPSLLNVSLQGAQFADGRVTYLEDQVTAVVTSPDEMHGTLDAAARQLAGDGAWAPVFRAAYPTGTVGGHELRLALASYLRSLVALDAPFDRYVRGDRAALSDDAKRGFTVFMGKAKCGSCHFAPLFNGTVPPAFAETEYEVIGVPMRGGSRTLDPDRGRETVSKSALQRFGFKTPTVRNAALTAPYMHNGALTSLDAVIDFYEKGGGVGLGMTLPNQTLPFDRLQLTAADKRALRAFMEALTDTVPGP